MTGPQGPQGMTGPVGPDLAANTMLFTTLATDLQITGSSTTPIQKILWDSPVIQPSSGWNGTTYTVSQPGHYYYTLNAIFNPIPGDGVYLALLVNNNFNENYTNLTNYIPTNTVSIGGIVKLNVNDTVEAAVQAANAGTLIGNNRPGTDIRDATAGTSFTLYRISA
jgi:hypothetical protein